MINKSALRAMTATALFAFATSASALTISLDTEFSGGTDPSGDPPWLTAVFTDVTGGVELTLTSLLQGSGEFVSGWYFNLDPDLNPNSLVFGTPTGGTWGMPTISTGVNAFKADGDGWFDILFAMDIAPPADRFDGADTMTVLISGIVGLTADDFLFNSAPGGGNGTWTSAAQVQGIGPTANLSGWIGGNEGGPDDPGQVPEPGVLFLLGAGLLGLGLARRRKSA